MRVMASAPLALSAMQAARERAASFLMFFFMMIASFLSCRACGHSVSIVCRRGFPLSTVISYQVNLNRTFEAKIFFSARKMIKSGLLRPALI